MAILFAVASSTAATVADRVGPPIGSSPSVAFLVAMAFAAGTAGSQTIRLDRRTLQPVPTLVFVVCAAMLFGPTGAGVVGLVAALAASRRSPLPAIIVHAGLGVLAGTSAGLVAYELLAAAPALNVTIAISLTALAGIAVWALGVFIVGVARGTGRSHRTLSLVAESADLVVAIAFGPALVTCYRHAGLLAAMLLTLALVAMFLAFRMYRERLLDLHIELTQLSRTDPLTGVGNRRAFDELLEQELSAASRSGINIGLLLIDVDHFKSINDAHGHDAGDRALKHVSTCLTGRLRREDRVARVGGDEFAAIVTHLTNDTDLQEVVDSLCLAVHQAVALRPDQDLAPAVTLSIGGASSRSYPDSDGLRRAADRALYAAKAQGRDRGVVYATADDASAISSR